MKDKRQAFVNQYSLQGNLRTLIFYSERVMSKPWSRDIKLNRGTFGGSPACHVLVDMMNNNMIPVSEKHRVLAFINNSICQFKWISTIPDQGARMRSMVLMKEDLYKRIDQMSYPPKFLSHLKCVINHHFRKYLDVVVRTIAP